MERRKFFFRISGGIFLTIIIVAIVFFMTRDGEPIPTVFFNHDTKNGWESKFKMSDSNNWNFKDDRLSYLNSSGGKGQVSVITKNITSEGKKEGYVTTRVTMSGNFDKIDDAAIWGILIGNESSLDKDKIFIGIDGKGSVVALSGELETLSTEKLNASVTGKEEPLQKLIACGESVTLELNFYENKYGWVLFVGVQGSENQCASGGYLNFIPAYKFSSLQKEIALVAYTPKGTNQKIWFKDWKVYKDWTPND